MSSPLFLWRKEIVMLNRKRIAAAVLAGIVSAASMTVMGCGRHAADVNQSSEDIEIRLPQSHWL